MYSRLLCELEIDHAIDEFLIARGLTLETDRRVLEDFRAIHGETFVETTERVLGRMGI